MFADPGPNRGLGNAPMYQTPGTVVNMAPEMIGSAGGSQAHENMQPYLAINFIIALVGIYPSRS
jgi:microcystin-dependent protein